MCSCNHCSRERAINIIILCVCVCSLNHPACKTHAPCYVNRAASLALQHFFTLFRFLQKSYWTWSVFWFSLRHLSGKFLILRRIQGDIIKMCIDLPVKYPVFSSDFVVRFWKNYAYQTFMKIFWVGAELCHADGLIYRRTDR